MTYDTSGDDAPAPRTVLEVHITDLGGSLRRVQVVHPRTGDAMAEDVDFLEDGDESLTLKELVLTMLQRHPATPEG